MTVEQSIMVWVAKADLFITGCLPYLPLVLLMVICCVSALMWTGRS